MHIPLVLYKLIPKPHPRPKRRIVIYARLALAISTAIVFVVITWFLYQDFWQPLTQTSVILVLRREVAIQDINIQEFEAVQRAHAFKRARYLGAFIPDPFTSAVARAIIDKATSNQ